MLTIDDSGVHINTIEENQAAQLAALQAMSPGIPSGMTGSLEEDMISTSALLMYQLDQSVAALLGSLNPAYAIEPIARNLGAALGIPAKTEGKSTVVVQITGNPGAFIPQGFAVKDSAGNQFSVTSYNTIPAAGVLSVTMEAVDNGDIIVAPGTLTIIVAPRTGIVSVTNPSASTTAQNAETMLQFRARLNTAMQAQQAGVYPAIKTAISLIDNVILRTIRVIPTGSGVEVIAAGGDDYSVAGAIFANVLDLDGLSSSATDPARAMTINVIDGHDTYPVKFTRPESATIGIAVTYSTINSVNQTSFATAAQTAIVDYVNAKASGVGINTLELSSIIASAVSGQVPIGNISRMTFEFTVDGSAATPTNNILELLPDQYPVTDIGNLTFVKV